MKRAGYQQQAQRPSNEIGSRLAAVRIPSAWPTPTPPRPEPVLVWPHLVLADEACGYIPRDAQLREDMYRNTCGNADGWPIPLTYCGAS